MILSVVETRYASNVVTFYVINDLRFGYEFLINNKGFRFKKEWFKFYSGECFCVYEPHKNYFYISKGGFGFEIDDGLRIGFETKYEIIKIIS